MQTKEKTLAMTEKLDADWDNIFSSMVPSKTKQQEKESTKDDYDIYVQQLKFEPRGQVYIVNCYPLSIQDKATIIIITKIIQFEN